MKHTAFLLQIIGASALLLGGSTAFAQTQLLLDGTFDTTPAITAGSFSQAVGRTGTTGATQILNGTAGATTGWFTTESDGLFEVWTPGVQGSPTTAGNTVELANTTGGTTLRQDVTTAAGAGASATFSFGYASRDSGNDKFTLTVTDQTKGTTTLTQAFNPTAAFATNTVYSNTFAITPGDVYRVGFLDQNTTGTAGLTTGTQSVHIDSVSFIQSPVPEPSTTACLAAAVALIAWRLVARRFAKAG